MAKKGVSVKKCQVRWIEKKWEKTRNYKTGKKRKREDKYTDIMNIMKEDIEGGDKDKPE